MERATPSPRPARRPWRHAVRRLPQDDDACGWTTGLPELASPRRLSGARRVDCAVIGAGYTGLAAARRLSELCPDWHLAVVEAQRVGGGASGRASGFVVDLADLTAQMSPEDRARHVRIARCGLEQLRELARRHEIACDWNEKGWIRAAASDEGERFLDLWPAWLDAAGIRHHALDAAALRGITGTSFYRRGLRLPGMPLVQAGALIRGLAAHLPESVELYEDSPVTHLEQSGSGTRLGIAGGGTLFTERLILATNGYTPACGFLERRIFPVHTFGGLTRVLRADEALERLMEGRTTLVVAHRLSTVKKADRIAVLDAGRLIELGSHGELIEHDGLYARLWRHQFREEELAVDQDEAAMAPSADSRETWTS